MDVERSRRGIQLRLGAELEAVRRYREVILHGEPRVISEPQLQRQARECRKTGRRLKVRVEPAQREQETRRIAPRQLKRHVAAQRVLRHSRIMQAGRQRQYLLDRVEDSDEIQVYLHHRRVRGWNEAADLS